MDETYLTIEVQEKKIDTKERSVTHYISKKSLDRGGDIVLPDSIKDENYKKNPIVLFNHNSNYPIGKSLWRKSEEEGVLAKTQFGSTPFADDIYQLNKEGVLNAWSIGFIPKKWDFDQEAKITTFTEIELLEYSSVSIPMNQDAVTEALKMVKSNSVKEILTNQIEGSKLKTQIESFTKELNEIKELYNKLSALINQDHLEDLEKAEKEILEIREEIKELKKTLSVGTLGKDELVDSITKRLSGKVSR